MGVTALLAASLSLAYGPGFMNPILPMDDLLQIGYPARLISEEGIAAIFTPHPYYRPVSDLAKAALAEIAGPSGPVFRALGLAFHAAVCVMLFRLGLLATGAVWPAAAGAAVFAGAWTHWELVAAVANGLQETLAAAAALAALLAYAGTRSRLAGLSAAAALIISLGSYGFWPHFALIAWLWDATIGNRQRRWAWYAAFGVLGAGWLSMDIVPALLGGERYPQAPGSGLWPGVGWGRNLLAFASYPWAPFPWMFGFGAQVAKGLLAAVTMAWVARAWWRGRSGERFFAGWTVLAAILFLPRVALDARHFYMVMFGLAGLLACSLATWPRPAAVALTLALVAKLGMDAAWHRRQAAAYGEAGRQAWGILREIKRMRPDMAAGTRVDVEGLPAATSAGIGVLPELWGDMLWPLYRVRLTARNDPPVPGASVIRLRWTGERLVGR